MGVTSRYWRKNLAPFVTPTRSQIETNYDSLTCYSRLRTHILSVPVLGVCCHVSTSDWLTSLPAHVAIGLGFGFGFTPLD